MKRSNQHKPTPPRWAHCLLTWLHPANTLEEVEGDLDELYVYWYNRAGPTQATLRYVLNVVSVLPPFVRRRQQSNQYTHPSILHPDMFQNYFKIALRNLFKQKVYSVFNLLGLALGISCGLLLTLHIKEELSYEKDFQNYDRIYRVATTEWSKSSPPLAGAMKPYFPDIEQIVRFSSRGTRVVNSEFNEQGESTGYFADSSAVPVFSLKTVAGNPIRALAEPASIVITQKMAAKFFGKRNPIGRKLIFDSNEELWVKAVIENLPENTHLKFDYLASMPTFYKYVPESLTGNKGWMFGWTYVLFRHKDDVAKAEKRLMDFLLTYYAPGNEKDVRETTEFARTVRFQPLTDIHLKSNLIQEMGANSNIVYIYIFIAAEVLILLIACFNFINLFTTQALRRAKEVGMRKVLGARKSQVIGQFLGEAFILTLLASLMAICLYEIALPFYNSLAGKQVSAWEIFRPDNLLIIGLIVLSIGLLSGLFPSLFISHFEPITSLKADKLPKSSASLLRKSLIVAQFVVSAFLIMATILIYQQMNLLRNKQLGFDKEQVLIVKLYGKFKEKVLVNTELFKNELTRNHSILAVAQSSNLIGDDLSVESVTPLNPPAGKDYPSVKVARVDEDYLNVLQIKLKEGRNFSHQFNDSASFIINERAVELLGLKNPVGAIVVNDSDKRQGKVIGLVRDFNFASLHNQVEPLVLEYKPQFSGNLLVKIKPGNPQEAVAFLKNTVEKLAPNTLFSYSFLDERVDALYTKEDNMSGILNGFSGLAIIISCLGLFGLVVHESKIRTKEIGIRKVLGASVSNLVGLLSGSFIKLVLIGILIAAPLTWYLIDKWLQGFAYKIDIHWWVFVLAGLLIIAVALLTVSFQSIKAALMNPVNSLRSE
ncbi:FtsX-like permease family protein [Spirosoma foliorum]|uniref:ABC transporter permease n=1 Tax=Spirosoma foliorum TaxID=2710596 RepID=A0A7G5H3U6_9BACT|nr:FtsX-like permease family protein [Spirosoma foliorum]QMW05788.1 ABC transporter permease [Spirosoma foliorum]